MSKKDLMLKILLPILIFLISIVLTAILVKTRSTPQRAVRSFNGPLVEVMSIVKEKRQIMVPGTGTVQSTQEADVTPRVSGQIRYISDRMVAGGFFRQGELLFSIEKIDYELALERAMSSQAQAELELMRNQSLAEIARLEWGRMDQDENRKANPLTLYEPQLRAAEAQVASAKSGVKQAELDLSRTTVRAPFDCYIRNEQVDVGQYVRAGNKVATVAGTDAVEIVVPLQLEELDWLQVPRSGKKTGKGSPATVRMVVGANRHQWQGEIVRSLGEIDPRSRMAKVVVAVSDPFATKGQGAEERAELAPGMFVEVLLHGTELADVVVIPRGAVRDNNTVWVADENKKLKILPIEIVRQERQEVLVSSGLEPGDQLVLTGLAAAADGMLLRPQVREATE